MVGRGTDRVEELIDNILERVILRLNPEPVIPCEAVTNNKAAQDVIRANDTDHPEGKERQGNSESQE
jgi:hypothetical protein